MRRAIFSPLVAVALVGSLARDARAQPIDRAEALFQEAKGLMAAGRPHEACPKLEESLRVEEGAGTRLALALCYEQDGRRASALVQFREALAAAEAANREERAAVARDHLRALEPRAP